MTTASAAYTVQETASLLSIPISTLYRRLQQGQAKELKPIRLGSTTRFPKTHIDNLLGVTA